MKFVNTSFFDDLLRDVMNVREGQQNETSLSFEICTKKKMYAVKW